MSEPQLQGPRRAGVAVRARARRAPVGRGAMDVLPAVAAVDDAGPMLQVPGAGSLALPRGRMRAMRDVAALGVRREHWLMTPGAGADGLHARIERVESLGDLTLVHCVLQGADDVVVTVRTAWPGAQALPRALRVRLEVRPWDLTLFDAQGRVLTV